MQRVLVVGQSGSGKSTAAHVLARHLPVPHVELDALFHGPGWGPRTTFVAGNRERLHTVLRATHPIRWTWRTHARHRAEYEARTAGVAHITLHRLRTRQQADAWLRDYRTP